MVIDYLDLYEDLCNKFMTQNITCKESKRLLKLSEWIDNDNIFTNEDEYID